MLIKASRITNLTDARYFAAKEVDFLGFNLEQGTEGYLDPMYMKAMREWVEGPKIVGEFSQAPIAYVREAATFFGLDAVQVSGRMHGSELDKLEGLEVILKIDNTQGMRISLESLEKAAPFVRYFLLDLSGEIVSKTGIFSNAEFWKSVCETYPVLLQADLSAEQWPELLNILNPAGISLVGGDEEKVGVKSFDEIEAIFEILGK